jgi:hypothetical protein
MFEAIRMESDPYLSLLTDETTPYLKFTDGRTTAQVSLGSLDALTDPEAWEQTGGNSPEIRQKRATNMLLSPALVYAFLNNEVTLTTEAKGQEQKAREVMGRWIGEAIAKLYPPEEALKRQETYAQEAHIPTEIGVQAAIIAKEDLMQIVQTVRPLKKEL